jgi:hypothetical protein
MKLVGLTVVALFTITSLAGATSCYMDQYGNEYWFDINFAEGYLYGSTVSNQNCDAPEWYLQGTFHVTTSGIEFVLSASNPLGDADTSCIASYMLKGKKVGPDWQFMWYYPSNPYGSQQANLAPCGVDISVPADGQGARR